ncbi:MAG: DUF2589 domain-containing protein [Kiloniellaceae bacterium]
MATAQPPLVSMAEQFTGLPMKDLIGAPMAAAASANAMMATTQVNFLLDTCFSYDEANKNYTPIMITMAITRGVLVPVDPTVADQEPTIEQVDTTFDLPLLTLLPLNSLAVDEVQVDFEMEVKSSFAEATNQATETAMAAKSDWAAKVGYGIFSAEIKGSVSYDSKSSSSHDTNYQKSNSAKYTVMAHAGQLPLPDGVKVIIEAFTNAISPITMPVIESA